MTFLPERDRTLFARAAQLLAAAAFVLALGLARSLERAARAVAVRVAVAMKELVAAVAGARHELGGITGSAFETAPAGAASGSHAAEDSKIGG